MSRKYFGTDGIRGLVGEFPITPDFAMKFGYAVGTVLRKITPHPAVVIGKDTRLSGYLFESSLEAGFSYAGVDVYMVGPIPTPAVAYLTQKMNLTGGVVISASHNPYMDNGLKLFGSNGAKLSDEIEKDIEQALMSEMQMAPKLGKVVRLEHAREEYVNFCKSTFLPLTSLQGMNIVLDCANGATYQVAPDVFTQLGANVIKLACEPNGTNINDACGSMHPEGLMQTVVDTQADLGIAFDGDGDRVLFVDRQGRMYNGDQLTYIIFKSYLALDKKISGIIGTVMTNLAMEHALNLKGFELVRTRVGDRYVLEELNRRGWHLGGESSGHIICLDKHTTGDGIIAALQVLSAMLKLKQPLHELLDWLAYPQVMINISLDDKSAMDDWMSRCGSVIDEAKSELKEDGRVIVRASGTEPVVRVMVEAKTHELASFWAKKISSQITVAL